MIYKKYDCDSYNIHTIKTDKFKSCTIEVSFKNKLDKDKITEINCVCDLLTQSSKKYPKRKDIVANFENLYNASSRMVSYRLGNTHFKSLITNFLNPKYCEKGYLNELLDFIFELLLNPNVKNNEFDVSSFNIVKSRIVADIQSIKENAAKYAFRRSFINMDSESPISYSADGYIEDFDHISPSSLYKTYKEILDTDICDIWIVGNLDMDDIVSRIKKRFKNFVIKDYKTDIYSSSKLRKKSQTIIEKGPYIQDNLIMIYNLVDLTPLEKDVTIFVLNVIFGGGSLTTKLAKYLREENSLCYSVYSRYQKPDRLLIVQAGIDRVNFEKAVKLVKKAFKEIESGHISDEELKSAKVYLISSVKMSQDSLSGILNNYVFNYLDDRPLFEERVELINKITNEDIIKVAKKVKLNTIYLLSNGGENNGKNRD